MKTGYIFLTFPKLTLKVNILLVSLASELCCLKPGENSQNRLTHMQTDLYPMWPE